MFNPQVNKIFLPLFILGFILITKIATAAISDVETAILKENYQEAKKLAQELIGTNSDKNVSNHAKYYLALSQLRLKEYKDARDVFKQLIQSPVDVQMRDKAYLGLFDSYYLDEQYADALEAMQRLLIVSPKSEFLSLTYLKLARVNMKLAHWKEAHEYLDKIINRFPMSMEFYIAKQLLEEKEYFAVQLGSFTDRDLAEKLVDELKRKNEYAYVVETTDQQNKKFYRVRAGQLASIDQAQKLKSRLAGLGYPTQIYP